MSKRRRKAKSIVAPEPQTGSTHADLISANYHIAAVIVLALLAALVYANSLDNDFVWDDNFQIVRNPFLHGDQPLTRLLFTDVWGYTHPDQKGTSNYYRPLQMISYRWIGQIAGMSPFSFHAYNLLFHILATLAGYLVTWQLTRQFWLTLSASILFALHPIHTEAVTWIAALPELGAALFYFLSFWLFLRAFDLERQTGTPTSEKVAHLRYLRFGSVVCFALSTLWKEMVLTLPIVIAVYLFIVHATHESFVRRLWKAIRAALPYLAVVAAYLLVRYLVLGFISRVQHQWPMSGAEFILNVVFLVGKYWLKLFLPLELNSFHLFDPVQSPADPRFLSAIIFLSVVGMLTLKAWKSSPLAVFSTAWVFVTLVPVLNIRGVGANVFSERYLYIPSLGFCLLVAWCGKRALDFASENLRWQLGGGALAMVGLLYSVQTVSRNRDWKDELALFSSAVTRSPNSAQMRNSLAQSYIERSMPEEAERQYLEAIRVGWERQPPDTDAIANAHGGLGGIYVGRHEYQKALDSVERGLATGKFQMKGSAYGIALMRVGRLQEAAEALYEYHLQSPNDEITLDALGVLALSQKELDKAVSYFQKAIQILPNFASAHNNLGRTYLEMARPADALPHLQKAVAISPRDPVVQTNLGTALAALGRIDEARAALQRALSIAPSYEPARVQLQSLEPLHQNVRSKS